MDQKNTLTNNGTNQDLLKRTEFACATFDDRYVFVAGGRQKRLKSAAVYDMHTNTQMTLPDFPTKLSCCKGAISNGYFYVISCGQIYRMNIMNIATATRFVK